MKYGLMIIVTILLVIIISEIKQQSDQLSSIGHHMEQIEQLEKGIHNE